MDKKFIIDHPAGNNTMSRITQFSLSKTTVTTLWPGISTDHHALSFNLLAKTVHLIPPNQELLSYGQKVK